MTHEMDIHDILQYLPHRHPFLLIDRIVSLEKGKSITALKNVTINENFFVGHFPGNPVMPGVLILEALAQAGAVLAYRSTDKTPADGVLFLFAGIDKARFRRVVVPGDQLTLVVTFLRARKEVWKLEGKAYVDGDLACSAEFLSAKQQQE